MSAIQSLVIDKAIEADVPILLEMIRELAAFEHLQEELEVTSASLRDALFGKCPAAQALLARVGEAPAGYAVYYRTFSTFTGRPGIFLDDVYVRPAYRKRGVGRKLMQCAARAGNDGKPGRYEWTALRWNENALKFYENLGAKMLTDWVFVRLQGEPLHALVKE